jgi:hypothetical protein
VTEELHAAQGMANKPSTRVPEQGSPLSSPPE